MTSNLDRYKADLEKLTLLGRDMRIDVEFRHTASERKLSEKEQTIATKVRDHFETHYQKWYTESLVLLRQLLPERLSEFEHLYKGDGKRRTIDATSYNIQDWLNGFRATANLFNDFAATVMRFKTQLKILEAVERRFESTLFDIKQLVQADLFDSELESARELVKNGFLRPAGAVSGVVLEKHLAQVAQNHQLPLRKQHPTIGDFNDALKAAGVLDTPAWRGIQRLGDLRNLCDHNKHREPTKDDITELVDGTDKITKTLF